MKVPHLFNCVVVAEVVVFFAVFVGDFIATKIRPNESYNHEILKEALQHQNKRGEVQSTRFTKQKQEGWVCVLGDRRTNQVVALKRVSFFPRCKNIPITFEAPENTGKYVYSFYFMSDCYIDFDQQFDICLEVT